MRFVLLLLPVLLCGCGARWSSTDAVRGLAPVKGPNRIVCWGDSMTAGDEGVSNLGTYPDLLQATIGPQIVNMGVGGQTSTQIGVRQGGVASYVTVSGGTIPAHGSVTVKFAAGFEPVTVPTRTLQGSIAGVEGTISLSSPLPAGTFSFTPVAGSRTPVTITGTTQFIPDTPYATYLSIFWEGRNNMFSTAAGPWGPAQIESDIAAQVRSLPKGLNYLVLPVLNENYTGERKGGANYAVLINLNDTLAATYGTHFLDIRSLLVNSYDPTSPVDVSDFKYDMPPTSLNAMSAQGTLVDGIRSTDTAFAVNFMSGALHAGQNIVIDHENIRILAINGSTVTSCIRGYGGVLASHAAGAAAIQYDATHLNKQGYAIVAGAIHTRLASM